MKKISLALALSMMATSGHAVQCLVNGYTRADGTVVASYTREQATCHKPAGGHIPNAVVNVLTLIVVGAMIYWVYDHYYASHGPRTIVVKFSDGSTHTYEEVPENVTNEMVVERVKKDFPNKVML